MSRAESHVFRPSAVVLQRRFSHNRSTETVYQSDLSERSVPKHIPRTTKAHTVTIIPAVLLGAALLFAQLFPLSTAAQAPSAAAPLTGPEAAQQAARTCIACHNENWRTPVLAIFQTKHAVAADKRTPFADQACMTCHGQSAAHLKGPAFPPDMFFGRKSTIPVAERNAKCLTCHQGGKRMLWAGSTHESRDVACASPPDTRRAGQGAHKLTSLKCASPAIGETRRDHRTSRHPIKEGKVASDCHNPHGTAGPTLLVRRSEQHLLHLPHGEARAVRPQSSAEPKTARLATTRGSTNRALLRQRLPFLCQQCHEASTIKATSLR